MITSVKNGLIIVKYRWRLSLCLVRLWESCSNTPPKNLMSVLNIYQPLKRVSLTKNTILIKRTGITSFVLLIMLLHTFFDNVLLHHTQIEKDSYDDNILLHHVMRNLDTDDYFSCERVSKSFHRALNHPSTDKVWCYIALKSELKNNLHYLQNLPAYFRGSGLVEEDYEFNHTDCWKDAVCFKRVIGLIRQERKKSTSCAVVSFNKKRDWCPYQFQKELVLDIYKKCIKYSHGRPLKLREDSLRLLLDIVSNHIQDILECSLLADIHRCHHTEQTEFGEESAVHAD